MTGLQLAHEAAIAAPPDVIVTEEPRRKAEEGMDGLAADVDRREPRGSQDNIPASLLETFSSVDFPVPARPVMNRWPSPSLR